MRAFTALIFLAVSSGVHAHISTRAKAASGPVNVPLKASSVESLGPTTDRKSNPGIYHDGGSGVTQGGYHLMLFADSWTNSSGLNFVHNSLAYLGYRNASDPTDLYMLGMTGSAGKKTFTGPAIKPLPNTNETAMGPYFSVWATSGLAALPDNKTVVGVFPALNETTGTPNLYSTMFTVEVVDPATLEDDKYPPITRVAPQLFYPDEVNYGSFSSYVNGSHLYLLGADTTGIKIARVAANVSTIADRTKYTYFNGSSQKWEATPGRLHDNSTNILSWTSEFFKAKLYPSSGDIYFSEHHNTFVIVFSDNGVDGAFRASYSTSGHIRGPWTEPVTVYSPPVPAPCQKTGAAWNYQAHSHYGVDPSGKTLLLSYSSCATYVSMARLHWT